MRRKAFKNTGPLAGQVGLPSDGPRWRCPACSLLVKFDRTRCPRCTETVTDSEQKKYEVRPESIPKRHVPLHLAKPNPNNNKQKANASVKEKPNSRKKSEHQKKTKNIRGFGKKGKTSNVRTKKEKMKKLDKPIHKQDPKKLGYKPSTKGNVTHCTRSRLNNDTASYRGKFQDKAKPLGGRKMNIATIEHLVSKNGFNTTIKKMKNGWDNHADRPVTPPGKKKGKKVNSWISALQGAASTGAVASLRHREKFHQAQHLDIGGKKSKFAL